jgi:monoamine oxidase
MAQSHDFSRRHLLQSGLGAIVAAAGCSPAQPHAHIEGGFAGVSMERGHFLRDVLQTPQSLTAPAKFLNTQVLVLGGGVAGLAATRALRLRGVEDFALLEMEDESGGNARGAVVNGLACPLGAHYLPLPGDAAHDVQDLLEEMGLRTRVAGRWQYDERHLCHSPQERLYFQGNWQEGQLPVQGIGARTLAQYGKFAQLVETVQRTSVWSIPVSSRAPGHEQRALAAITFAAYLEQNGLTDAHLRWYLDYCCRDDFGAGSDVVSAWSGVHYFASRHGFHAPGAENVERESLLTWPQGNAFLTNYLAAPLGERQRTGRTVLRVVQTRSGVEVDAYDSASRAVERWHAKRAIVALPVHVAVRVVQDPPAFLREAAQRVRYAPWLVANLHISAPLHDRPGAPPSWDNVVYGAPGLGYVDAMHQSLHSVAGATVLTYYRALGLDPLARRTLQDTPWGAWRDAILSELSTAHPDLAAKTTRMDITRYGHAMAVPVPNDQGQIGLQPNKYLRQQLSKTERVALGEGNLRFAHSDWAGYSVFEEAFTMGHLSA